jgi:microcystin-dependent protein
MDPFLGEIRMNAFAFAPRNWATCDGTLMAISQNTALFSLLGTQFGGNGTTQFQLPDLRGRVPMGQSPGEFIGGQAGAESITLTSAQLPAHSHTPRASNQPGNQPTPNSGVFAATPPADTFPIYAAPGAIQPLTASTVGPAGSSQPHPNVQPMLVVSFCIALSGIYPSRS